MEYIEFLVLKASQNIGDLYLGVMSAWDLYEIAEVDRIRMINLKVPKYAGYQRALADERVTSIKDYLSTPKSTFPNAIICSLDSEFIEEWEDIEGIANLSRVKIQRDTGAIRIIDGQHRAAALDAADESFQVLVSFFIDLNVVQSAGIFAKINSTQRAVNPSIAFQLFGYSEDRSPQKTAHEIAQIMNTTEGSPFYKMLRMLGTKDSWAIGTLSQSTFAKQLMQLYSRKPEDDQNRYLRGEELEDYLGYPLRNWFKEEKDERILEVVWKYFFNIAETWQDQWTGQDGTSILTKTTGYSAFMQLLKRWLESNRADEVINDEGVQEAFIAIKERYETEDKRFVRANYPAGNQGIQLLRNALLDDLNIEV